MASTPLHAAGVVHADAIDAPIVSASILQGSEVKLIENGKPVDLATQRPPLIASRPWVLVATLAKQQGDVKKGRLLEVEVNNGGHTEVRSFPFDTAFEGNKAFPNAGENSHGQFAASTFGVGTTIRFRITSAEPGSTLGIVPGAHRFPREGGWFKPALVETPTLRVRIVPVLFKTSTADPSFSERDPTLPERVGRSLQNLLQSLFPVQRAEVDVGLPIHFNGPLTPTITSQLFAAVALRRMRDHATDTYYMGFVVPNSQEDKNLISTLPTQPFRSPLRWYRGRSGRHARA